MHVHRRLSATHVCASSAMSAISLFPNPSWTPHTSVINRSLALVLIGCSFIAVVFILINHTKALRNSTRAIIAMACPYGILVRGISL